MKRFINWANSKVNPGPTERKKITRSFPEFFAHVKKLDFDPSVCIDVGAASGTSSIYGAFPNAFHIAFEPLEDFQPALRRTLKPYRHEIYQLALMEHSKEQKILRQKNNLYTSSLMHTRHENTEENLLTVPVKTLDEVMVNHSIEGEYLIKTDCQGADLFVLQGGKETLKNAEIVIVETSFFRFWGPHQPDFARIVRFMHVNGFAVYDILEGMFRPHDNALGQVDLVFAKQKGRFRKITSW